MEFDFLTPLWANLDRHALYLAAIGVELLMAAGLTMLLARISGARTATRRWVQAAVVATIVVLLMNVMLNGLVFAWMANAARGG